MSSSFLDQYESVDIIGTGSFGIIRKVRRKADGQIFARKELNFERMSERDRKQIVAEVNILKDLHHDHIVRYHDRYVDREAGILYILMEYCGGGDLSTVIKQAIKHERPIPEDTIWNYFMQILLALHQCHHPNGHGRSNSGVGPISGSDDGKDRRVQVLHRDLKPDNVFLDENHIVKLGDFGLSKALAHTSFANTYVGTPYYMSPELMQERAYDTKSDIWSLGCLMYEMCALKPPFHEAKTHSELSILIRNGRIPPLPKGYSQALASTIKSMLNLNPAMRPSVTQLLQHERLELVFKVSEAEKMLATVKSHKTNLVARERDLNAREGMFREKERHLNSTLAQKDNEIASLHQQLAQQQQNAFSQVDVERLVKEAISRREEELRILVTKREEEVAAAMARREEEIIASVNRREAELCEAWASREEQIRSEYQDHVEWIQTREIELNEEDARLSQMKIQLEERLHKLEDKWKSRKDKGPLEEVKNLLTPVVNSAPSTLSSLEDESPPTSRRRSPSPFPAIATPMQRQVDSLHDPQPSAMKGVILTATGEVLNTPKPAELASLFGKSPKVGLNFTKIFDPESHSDSSDDGAESGGEDAHSPPPSPSVRKQRGHRGSVSSASDHSSSSDTPTSSRSSSTNKAPPTRIRRPSIRSSSQRPGPTQSNAVSFPASVSEPGSLSSSSPSTQQPKPLPHPHLHTKRTQTAPAAVYDLQDEENLPSPFLKRVVADRSVAPSVSTKSGSAITKRPSTGNQLRALAAANASAKKNSTASAARTSVASARKAHDEARKALARP